MRSGSVMRSKHIAMSVEEFHALPMELGWKYEYWNGTAHITPSHGLVIATVPVSLREVKAPVEVRRLCDGDADAVNSAFIEAFADSVDYCDCDREAVARGAEYALNDFAKRERRKPSTASHVAIDPEDSAVIGAALVSGGAENPILRILFVAPGWRRRGIAAAVVAAALNRLHELGDARLTSSHLLANEASRRWHRAFGFIEEPDLPLTQYYLRHVNRELWRKENLGGLGSAEREALEAEVERLKRELQRLDEIEDQQGPSAVLAVRRFLDA